MTGAAELRLVRIMSAVIGAGALLFSLLAIEQIGREAGLTPHWWILIAGILVFGSPVVGALLIAVLELPAARVVLVTVAGLYFVPAIITLRLSSPSPWPDSLWVFNNTAAATSAAALALPRGAAWGYNGLVAALVIVERSGAAAGGAFAGIQHGLYSFALCGVFMALAQLVLSRAQRLDEETAIAARHAAAVEAARARHSERDRVDALLHDTVLATLMLASRGGDHVEPALRSQAAAAVVALDAEASGYPELQLEFGALLTERLTKVDPRIAVSTSPPHEVLLPHRVADALADAAVEATRNALRHAQLDPGATPSVRIEQATGRCLVVIEDDGAGFQPDQIPAGRLGLQMSIFRRLGAIPGASAEIDSAPGRGTRVRLSWEAPS